MQSTFCDGDHENSTTPGVVKDFLSSSFIGGLDLVVYTLREVEGFCFENFQ